MLPRVMQDPLASTLFALACAAAGAAVGAAGLVRLPRTVQELDRRRPTG